MNVWFPRLAVVVRELFWGRPPALRPVTARPLPTAASWFVSCRLWIRTRPGLAAVSAVAGLWLVLVAFPAAQTVSDDVQDCFTGTGAGSAGASYTDMLAEATLRDGTPGSGRPLFHVRDPSEFLDLMSMCFAEAGGADGGYIRGISDSILIPLLLIVTVWFGVQVAFGGAFDANQVIMFVFRVGFVLMLLQFYHAPALQQTPFGQTHGVVFTISQQGIQWGRGLVTTANEAINGARLDAEAQARRQAVAFDAQITLDPEGDHTALSAEESEEAKAAGDNIKKVSWWKAAFLSAISFSWRTFLWVLSLLTYGQYLWGYIGIAVLGLVGPLLIPFMLVPQLDWLGWGWLKALIEVTVYMLMASIMYVVAVMVLQIPLAALAEAGYHGTADSQVDLSMIMMTTVLPYLPFAFAAFSAAGKVGAISSAMLQGAGLPAGGLASGAAAAAMNVADPDGRAAMRKRFQRGAGGKAMSGFYRGKDDATERYGVPLSARAKRRRQAQAALKEYQKRGLNIDDL